MPSAGLDYTKTDNVFAPVSAAYASMRLSEGWAQNYVGVMEIVSDDADKGSTEADGPTVGQLDNFTYGPDNNNVEAMWNYFYNISSAANYAIESMDKFDEGITSESGLAMVKECRGEAKVIRAYAYFNLVRLFGTVPVIDRTMTAGELASMPASKAEDVYKFVYADLDDAISVLPESFSDYKGRYNRYTAMALKAKVALYRKDWKEAARLTDLVIASGKYSLMSRFKEHKLRLFLLEVLFCGILVQLFPKLKTALTDESRIYPWEMALMPVLLFLCVISLVANTYNPFIYFRF